MATYRRRRLLQTGVFLGLGSSVLTHSLARSGIAQESSRSDTGSGLGSLRAPGWGEQLRVAFLLGDTLKDYGWSYSHDRARQRLVQQMGSSIVAVPIERTSPQQAEAEQTIRRLIEKGYRLFFDTRIEADPLSGIAAEFPEVIFLRCGEGITPTDNLGSYLARFEQPRYLSGMVAAAVSQSRQLGFVATQPHPEVIRGINAFALGAQSIDPEVRVQVVWIMGSDDPQQEVRLGENLIRSGCDVLTHHSDSSQIVQLAQAEGLFAIGYHSDMSALGQDAQLTACVHRWDQFYIDTVTAVLQGSWQADHTWLGFEGDMVALAPLKAVVSPEVRQRVTEQQVLFLTGQASPFTGPIRDQQGTVRLEDGAILSDQEQQQMDWYVTGVEGALS